VPIISDYWDGIGSIFELNKEILIAHSAEDVWDYFMSISEEQRREIGENARQKVLKKHTARARAKELEKYVREVMQPSEKV
jgi:spore maturation protein CgeB